MLTKTSEKKKKLGSKDTLVFIERAQKGFDKQKRAKIPSPYHGYVNKQILDSKDSPGLERDQKYSKELTKTLEQK